MKHLPGLENNFVRLIISAIAAVLIWFIISMTQYPSVQKTIANIPVSTDLTDTAAAASGLSVISCDVDKVTVELLGSRTQVGSLNNENLEAYIDAENVTSPGTKSLSIKIRGSKGINYEIKSIYPDSANVIVDKYTTRDFDVLPKIPNVTFAEGKASSPDEISCQPNVMSITGPSTTIDKISKCYAVSNKTLSLDSSYSIQNDEVQLYTEDGTLIDQEYLKFSVTNFNINIPVRTQKSVKLYVAIANAPSDFDQNSVNFKYSTESIILAANNSQTEIPDSLEIGKVILSDLKKDYSKTFTLSNVLENTEYINMSDVETVTVKLDDENLSQKEIFLDKSSITVSNTPDSSYEYSVGTQRLPVTVIGPEDVIEKITAEDIIADINLLKAEISTDQFYSSVTFSCPKYNNVWVVTNTKVAVQRTKLETSKTTQTTQTTSSY